MLAYVIRRLAATIVVMMVVAFVVFSLLYLTPGDPAAVLAGDAATTQDIQRIREKLGLDGPFLVRFASWMWAVGRGDLGTSIFTNLPVTRLIGQRVEPTLALAACTLIVAVSSLPDRSDAAVAQVRGLLQRLSQGAVTEQDLSAARRHFEEQDLAQTLDPRRRAVDLWRGGPSKAAPDLAALRRLLRALRTDNHVVVRVAEKD